MTNFPTSVDISEQHPEQSSQSIRTILYQSRSRFFSTGMLSGILVFSLILHILTTVTTHGAYPDIHNYVLQAQAALHGKNVYQATQEYPYPPVWIWCVAALKFLSDIANIRFDIIVKIPAIIGDITLIPMIYLFTRWQQGQTIAALIPAFLYAINPVPIFISAGHGQFDAFVLMFLYMAILMRSNHHNNHILFSSLAFGIAIALKGYPVLFLPYFVFTAPPKQRLRTLLYTSIPLISATILFITLFGYSAQMITHILLYTSPANFGWISILTNNHQMILLIWLLDHKIDIFAKGFLLISAVCLPIFYCKQDPMRAVIIIFGVFYLTTFSMSVQYMLWILPFLISALPIWGILYSAIAFVTTVNFYYTNYPAAIPLLPWTRSLLAIPLPYYDGSLAISLFSGILLVYLIFSNRNLGHNR